MGHQAYGVRIALLLLATAVRLAGLGSDSLWFDEAFTVVVTRLPLHDSLAALLAIGTNAPLHFVLLRPLTALWGQSEFAYRFLSAAFGILSVALVDRVGRRWLGEQAGLLAALTLAICPFHLLHSRDARMYVMMGFFSLAAMEQFEHVLRGGRWAPFILLSALAYSSQYAAIFLIYVQLVCLVPLLRRRRLLVRWFSAQALALLPLLPWFALYVARWETRSFGLGWIPQPTPLTVPRTLWNMVAGDVDHWPIAAALLAVAVALTLLRGLWPWERIHRMLAGWLWLPLVANLLVSLRRPFYVDRYFIGSLPALLLLLAAGVTSWQQRWLQWATALAVLTAMGWGTVRILNGDPYFAREDWRGATATVEAELQPGDAVVLQDQETLIAMSVYRNREWPYTVLAAGDEVPALEELTARHRRVWLVWRSPRESNHRLCKSDPFDIFSETPPAVRAWLTAQRPRVALELELPGITVLRIDTGGGEQTDRLLVPLAPLLPCSLAVLGGGR